MGVRDSLYNIDYELTRQNELLKKDKELKKLETDYKADIISALEQVFYDIFENAKVIDYKRCYNNFIINKDFYMEEVIIALNEIDLYRVNFENSMYNDVKRQYYKTLKDVYTEFNLDISAVGYKVQTNFENNLKKLFETIDYNTCINFLYDVENRKNIVELFSKNEKEKRYLDKNYTKIVSQYANEYKKYNTAPKKQVCSSAPKRAVKKNNNVGALLPLGIIGGAVYGACRGLYRVSKK